jgi:ribosome-associated protein
LKRKAPTSKSSTKQTASEDTREKPDSSLLIAKTAYEVSDDKKAWQPIVLDVSGITSLCQYVVIVSQAVKAQVRALAKSIEASLEEHKITPLGKEGMQTGQWVLLDYGDVLINVMHQPERDFYRLEEIWRKAPKVEFET